MASRNGRGAAWTDATGGSVPAGQEDLDERRVAGAVVLELRVLDDRFGTSVEIGDHLAQVTLHGLGPIRPGALTARRLVLGGADLRVGMEKEGIDGRRYVIVIGHADSLPVDAS
ncbi:hypothetical protein JOL79_18885 [Microbispora sp. RL4-1S]|uniref:Uncharacterized protein n=1 Tax=Microbispora oryzae TaxID=2806554 RepID=A0A940WRS7_9ACTN|nr:hypothetical protein [Microbispora oryzae]MBP2705876.1 hypothetical protein [Microbispora oryzae]